MSVPSVSFLLHPKRAEAAACFQESQLELKSMGIQVQEITDAKLNGDEDLVVSLGGDGTMLRAVDLSLERNLPVLGVNLGNLGYLTEVDPSETVQAITKFYAGDYYIDSRMTLSCKIILKEQDREDHPDDVYFALNEVVVERQKSGHVVRVDVEINGDSFIRYDADGVIVATPTGSTAYSLSARGPILSPSLDAIVLTPITPHMLFDRAIVLDGASKVELCLSTGPEASVMVDGRVVATLKNGDCMLCERSRICARLVRYQPRQFHSILKTKFGLSSKTGLRE